MENDPIEPEMSPGERQAARWILLRLLMDVRPDWNGQGAKFWAEERLRELEDEPLGPESMGDRLWGSPQ